MVLHASFLTSLAEIPALTQAKTCISSMVAGGAAVHERGTQPT